MRTRDVEKVKRVLLTVVLCTYNRSHFLSTCLWSLVGQNILFDEIEVVVVDNNSTDDTSVIAQDFEKRFQHFKYIFEAQQGLSYARNSGVSASSAGWIAFLDDDAVARPDWVEKILETIQKADFDLFGGVYTAWHVLRDRPRWFSPEWETNASVAREYSVLKDDYPSGGNCAYRHTLLLEAGGFPVGLGMKGDNTAYGEETALIDRLRKNGAVVGFVPEMIIDHCVIDRKYSLTWRLKRSFAVGRDSVAIWHEDSMFDLLKPIVKCAYYLVCSPMKAILSWLTKSDYYWQNVVLDSFSGFMLNWGRIVGGVRRICQ